MQRCAYLTSILMPKKDINLEKWAVVACDQYTSQMDYWLETEKIVGQSASSLRLILPEIYLETEESSKKIEDIHNKMNEYLNDGLFDTLENGLVIVERDTGKTATRKGLILKFDLECYEYKEGTKPLIRPSEKTVEERIPPRLAVRKGAKLELPHIMLLIDDENDEIIGGMFEKRDKFTKIYDVNLMKNGGNIKGWFVPECEESKKVLNLLDKLSDSEIFCKKYNADKNEPVLPFAVGDGNHSMATAKAYWEEIKKNLSEEEIKNHPARFVLAEVVNVHDESIEIEPIHRILFGTSMDKVNEFAQKYYKDLGASCEMCEENDKNHIFPMISGEKKSKLYVKNSPFALPAATIQTFLDAFLNENPDVKIDYIHGDDVLEELAAKKENVGFLLPALKKSDLFRGIIFDGVLPRKTFSMGNANEKRYYMEARKIVK